MNYKRKRDAKAKAQTVEEVIEKQEPKKTEEDEALKEAKELIKKKHNK